MERERNAGPVFPFANTVPDFAALHPGYVLRQRIRANKKPGVTAGLLILRRR
jgi:hypothetical protein